MPIMVRIRVFFVKSCVSPFFGRKLGMMGWTSVLHLYFSIYQIRRKYSSIIVSVSFWYVLTAGAINEGAFEFQILGYPCYGLKILLFPFQVCRLSWKFFVTNEILLAFDLIDFSFDGFDENILEIYLSNCCCARVALL